MIQHYIHTYIKDNLYVIALFFSLEFKLSLTCTLLHPVLRCDDYFYIQHLTGAVAFCFAFLRDVQSQTHPKYELHLL